MDCVDCHNHWQKHCQSYESFVRQKEMLQSNRFHFDFDLQAEASIYRFELRVELTKVSPVKKELILDMVIVEEMKCIVLVDSERFLIKIEHPTGKTSSKIGIGSDFDLDTLNLSRYQEFVLVYDIRKLKIYDLSLDRISMTRQFLKFPINSEISQILI